MTTDTTTAKRPAKRLLGPEKPATTTNNPQTDDAPDPGLLMARLSAVTIERNKIEARMAKAIDDARSRHQPSLDTLDQTIATLTQSLEEWALANRSTAFPGKTKTVRFQHGEIRLILGKPALVCLEKSKDPETKLIQRLRNADLCQYIITREAVDKRSLISDITTGAISPDHARTHLRVAVRQDERVHVKPAIEEAVPSPPIN